MSPDARRALEVRLALGVAVCAAIALVALFHGLRHDDAYITYRYGENLARGRGLVFNPGERVMGSTSPGHALAAAAVHLVAGHEATPAVMSSLGCAAWCGEAVAIFALLRRASTPIALAAAWLVLAGVAAPDAWIALETHWALAATLAAFALAAHDKWRLVAVSLAAAIWLRPDAVLAGLPLAALAFARRARRREAWVALATCAALVAPWYVFAWAYYGDPLPQSLHAKVGTTATGAYAAHVLDVVVGAIAPWGPRWAGAACVLAGWVMLLRRVRGAWPLAAYGVALLVAYLAMRPGKGYDWHLQPIVLIAAVGLYGGLAALVFPADGARMRTLGGAAFFAALAIPFVLRLAGGAASHPDDTWLGARDAVYRQAARHMAERSTKDDLVSHEEVGTLAYFSDLPVEDRAGLVTRTRMAEVQRYMAGMPTRLRWLVLKRPHLEDARPVYGGRAPFFARQGDFRIFVFDLREPDPGVPSR